MTTLFHRVCLERFGMDCVPISFLDNLSASKNYAWQDEERFPELDLSYVVRPPVEKE